MKRILILNYEFPPLGGGAANATYYLLKELAKESDLQVDLVTSSVDGYQEEQFAPNVKIYRLDIGKKGNVHYQSNLDLLKYSYKALSLAKRLKRQKHYDLVHAFFGIPCGFVAMKLGLPYVVSLRGSDVPFYNKRFELLDKLFFKRLSGVIWKNAKAVIANSDGLRKLANQSHQNQEIGVIYNGVDVDEFRPEEKNADDFIVISTSRLIERKGVDFLIEAFLPFAEKHANAKLIMVGGGNLEASLREKVAQKKKENQIEFLGAMNHDKLAELYRKADVFILPSLNEGMSNSLLEAMASGLAIVATDTGGTKELVDEKNGVIIEEGSADAIDKALEDLYRDRQKLTSMKLASRQKAEGMSWKAMKDKYLEVYGK